MNLKMMKLKQLIILMSLVFTSCHMDKSKPNFELIQDMMESPAVKPQEYDANSPQNSGMRVPPEHTQARGFTPYKYATDIEGAAKQVNPLAGNMSDEVLRVGQKFYTIQCSLCHGAQGEGGAQNSIGEKMMLKPPVLVNDKIKGWTDGQIYHVITVGQGLMGSYASAIPEKHRWQVVNYIRHLQKQ